jgi:putative DNA primase/helicase
MYDLLKLNSLSLEDAALAYISKGWFVLPLLPKGKQPYGKLVPNGVLQATDDLGQVRTWWEMSPGANIGLRTGMAFDVVDLDGDAALASMRVLAPKYKHQGPVASTGRGYHLLFRPTGARNAAKKVDGIDFRGQNGYIVAPPSVHPNGPKYIWARWKLTISLNASTPYGDQSET